MLGNDIIDLKKALDSSNWKRKGYLSKIFNAKEHLEILNAAYPETTIWKLWSMKEAAYKIIHRTDLQRCYNPTKFSCLLNEDEGFVNFENIILYTKSIINEDIIHTVACTTYENLSTIRTHYLENTNDYLLKFNSKLSHYVLEKDANGIPNLINKINGESHFASISHHGKYLAISYMLPTS